ncbi:MAG: glycerate kinase [Christensenellales bacterium]
MKIVIAPDSFKGTLSSVEVCGIIKKAINDFDGGIETAVVPIADGGEGTVDAFLHAAGGEKVYATVKDPLLRDVQAYYGILGDGSAVIEMAAASGLMHVENELKPLEASTFGTGQLILDAVQKGCGRIILGLGGSATTDGGAGAAMALGAKLLTKRGLPIPPGGGGLSQLYDIDFSEAAKTLCGIEIIVACDVDNILCGENGSAYVFAPQKGADEKQVKTLDDNLSHYAALLEKKLGRDIAGVKGAGAAGGFAVSLLAAADIRIMPGIDVVLETVGFDEIIKDADIIITGEGRIDGQSVGGKVPVGIARAAEPHCIPVVAIGGSLGDDYLKVMDEGVSCVFCSVKDAVPFETVKKTCGEDLYQLVRNLLIFGELMNGTV